MKKLIIILLTLLSLTLFGQTTCPPEGKGRNDKEKTLNTQKNRNCFVNSTAKIDSISIDSILKIGNDLNRFKVSQIVMIEGYIVSMKYGGSESCNCQAKDKAGWDIHLEIGKVPNSKNVECFIAEVTPKFPDRNNVDWKSLIGKKVLITGYIFYDIEHTHNAYNTNPSGTNLWRASIIEIHPVIGIEIIK